MGLTVWWNEGSPRNKTERQVPGLYYFEPCDLSCQIEITIFILQIRQLRLRGFNSLKIIHLGDVELALQSHPNLKVHSSFT